MLAPLLVAGPAAAQDPFAMTSPVEDVSADQVTAGGTARIDAARDRVLDGTDYDMWVVVVDSFDGAQPVPWADDVAVDSRAGADVLLVAVAVGDELVAVSADEDAALDDAALTQIERDGQRALRSGGAVAAAEAAADAILGASGVSTGGTQPGGSVSALAPLLVIGGVVLVVVVISVALSRRRKPDGGALPPAPAPRPRTPADEFAGVSTAQLGTRAGSALVELDNDVRSSGNELGFAEAQFGLEQTRDFKATLERAQQQLGEAFAVQRQLDGAAEDARRAGLIRVLLLCREAEQALDSQTEAMSQLRALQERAPELLTELAQRADEIEARIPAARAVLDQLRATFPASALSTVAQVPEQATSLVDAAERAVAEGRARVDAGDRGTAVEFARTAEDALQQVAGMLESVTHARATLEDAIGRLDGAIASVNDDLADAAQLGAGDAAVASAADRARTAVAAGEQARSGGDPVAAVTELVAAEQALDAALAPRREQQESVSRAGARLGSAMAVADAAVRRAHDYIGSNRGAVGEAARTRAAAAASAMGQAQSLATAQRPVEAVAAAEAATQQAHEATRLAEGDVSRWQSAQRPQLGGAGYGGGYYGRSSGIDTGSLILGGILGQVLGGGSSRRSSGGGGSSWGGTSRSGWGGTASRSTSRSSSAGARPRRSSGGGGGRSRRSSGGRSRR